MRASKRFSPSPTELIDWLNAEGLLELDWDFPNDGDLFAAGLDSPTALQAMTLALEDFYDVDIKPEDLNKTNLGTPEIMAAWIGATLI
ncbi:MAG: hypothetical protein RLZZ282_91 [Verrucomicrobiota bacterium]|jgi:acyl carrier protein